MPSVADALRLDTHAAVLRMTAGQRIALALALGEDDLRQYMRCSGLPRLEALRQLTASRHHGRATSHAAVPSGS